MTLSDDVVRGYNLLIDNGLIPKTVCDFAITVMNVVSQAYSAGHEVTTDYLMQDDSLVQITVRPGQGPIFNVIEKVHPDMGESNGG